MTLTDLALIAALVGGCAFVWYNLKVRPAKVEWECVSVTHRYLEKFEKLVDGKQYLGSQSEVATTFGKKSDSERVEMHYLCKTRNGAWYTARTLASPKAVLEFELTPVTEDGAKALVCQHKPEVYRKYFGEPTPA